MNPLKNLLNLSFAVVICSLSLQTPVAHAALSKTASRLTISKSEVAAIESRAERRFFNQFNRRFKAYSKSVDDAVIDNTDDELNKMYNETITWLEEHGNYDMANAMIASYAQSKGTTVKERMLNMSSEEARQNALKMLHLKIAEAGGFEKFYANAKALRKQHLRRKCVVGKVASYTAIAPVVVVSAMTAGAAMAAIYAGYFTPVVGAWIATTVGLDGFAVPRFLKQIMVGCYDNRVEDRDELTDLFKE